MTLSDAWQSLQREIAAMRDLIPATGVAAHSWATVTSTSPLRIRLDGASDPLDLTPDSLTGGHVVGQRVWVALHGRGGRRAIIIGATPTAWQTLTLTADWQPYEGQSGRVPRVRREGGLVSLWGQLSPATEAAVTALQGTSASGAASVTTLPVGMRPHADTVIVCQGSGTARWALNIATAGGVFANRYGGGTPSTTSWMPIHVTYLAA